MNDPYPTHKMTENSQQKHWNGSTTLQKQYTEQNQHSEDWPKCNSWQRWNRILQCIHRSAQRHAWPNSDSVPCISSALATFLKLRCVLNDAMSQKKRDSSHRNHVDFAVVADFMNSFHQHIENDLATRRREWARLFQKRKNRAHAKLGDCCKTRVVVFDQRFQQRRKQPIQRTLLFSGFCFFEIVHNGVDDAFHLQNEKRGENKDRLQHFVIEMLLLWESHRIVQSLKQTREDPTDELLEFRRGFHREAILQTATRTENHHWIGRFDVLLD